MVPEAQGELEQPRRADSLVRSNARKPRGVREARPARARALAFALLLPLRTLLRVKTRAPSLQPIPARGQSCPQQRTKTKRRPRSPPARARALAFARPSCPFGRCCGLKPALRHCSHSRRADSLVRSNARKPRGVRKPASTRTRSGLCAPLLPLRSLLRVKTRAPSLQPFPARGQSCPQQRTKTKRRPKARTARARASGFRAPLAPSDVAAG